MGGSAERAGFRPITFQLGSDMSVNFDAKSYISKQAFSPISEVWDHRKKMVISSSVKEGGVDQAVADIAATSRQVSAAAIKSLDLSKGAVLDLELLNGAIATLESVLKNTDGQLKDQHLGLLQSHLQKLQALKALHARKGGSELVSKHQDLYNSIAADLRRIDGSSARLAQFAAQLEGATKQDPASSGVSGSSSSGAAPSQGTSGSDVSPFVSPEMAASLKKPLEGVQSSIKQTLRTLKGSPSDASKESQLKEIQTILNAISGSSR